MRQECRTEQGLPPERTSRVRISGSHEGFVTLCVVCGYPGPRAVPTKLHRPTLVCV
jgi:hypothetical protein